MRLGRREAQVGEVSGRHGLPVAMAQQPDGQGGLLPEVEAPGKGIVDQVHQQAIKIGRALRHQADRYLLPAQVGRGLKAPGPGDHPKPLAAGLGPEPGRVDQPHFLKGRRQTVQGRGRRHLQGGLGKVDLGEGYFLQPDGDSHVSPGYGKIGRGLRLG